MDNRIVVLCSLVLCFFVHTIKAEGTAIYNGIDEGFDFRYDEYPSMPAGKRGALLLDRLMVALQRALKDDEPAKVDDDRQKLHYFEYGSEVFDPARYDDSTASGGSGMVREDDGDMMPRVPPPPAVLDFDNGIARVITAPGLQRRDPGTTVHPKGNIWRCYFNVVTCFRRK